MTTMTEILPAVTRPVATPRLRLLTGAVSRLLAVDFAAMCSFYLLLSVVPLYCADRGIGTAGAGLSTGLLMIAAVAAELGTRPLPRGWATAGCWRWDWSCWARRP